MTKTFLLISTLSGMIATGLGAFGAHALKTKLEGSGLLQTYQTAVSYQFYHTLALMAVALLMLKVQSQWLTLSGYSFIFGILLFSGSLFLMCFTGVRWLGAITPIGGLGFILGWAFLFWGVWKSSSVF